MNKDFQKGFFAKFLLYFLFIFKVFSPSIVLADLGRIMNQEENKSSDDYWSCRRQYEKAQYENSNDFQKQRFLVNKGKVYRVTVGRWSWMESRCESEFEGVINKDTMKYSCFPSFLNRKNRGNQVRWEIQGRKLVLFSRWKDCVDKEWENVSRYTFPQKN